MYSNRDCRIILSGSICVGKSKVSQVSQINEVASSYHVAIGGWIFRQYNIQSRLIM